jgi:hypothetical protein
MGLLFAAKTAQAAATTSTTTEKHERSISRWRSFLSTIGLQNDFFLDNFSVSERHQILSAFMEAIRSNKFSRYQKRRPPDIKAESCSAAMGHLAQAFTAADRPDPRLTRDGKFAVILRQQIKGYTNLDPSKQPQQALPINILLYLHSSAVTTTEKAAAELLIGAFFFAMRSCEYCKVNGERKTKLLAIKNFHFYKNKKLLKLNDNNLHQADVMKIVFESQKTEKKNQTVFHHSTYHPILCPIKIWASIIQRILKIPESSPNTTVNTILLINGSKQYLSNNYLITKLRLAAKIIGEDELGFTPSEIGLHSLHSGAAMAMFLAGIPTSTIQLMGRWASEAFMDYIRPQVEKFSSLVSKAMIANPTYFTIPHHDNNHRGYHSPFPNNNTHQHGLCQTIMIPNPITV